MCGIVGYIGQRDAAPILLEGLSRLEYRGYDSAGVAIQTGRGIVTRKLAGRVQALAEHVARLPLHGGAALRTRAGPPTEHPRSGTRIPTATATAGSRWCITASSKTPTRCARRWRARVTGFTPTRTPKRFAHLIEAAPGDTLEASCDCGARACRGYVRPRRAGRPRSREDRRGPSRSPVLLGIGEDEYFVGPIASAIMGHTRSVVYLDDGDIAVLTRDEYHIIDRESHIQLRAVDDVAWDLEAIELAITPLYAEGDPGAAGDGAEHAARAPRIRGWHGAPQRAEPDARSVRRHPAGRDCGVRHLVAFRARGSPPDRGAGGNPRDGRVRVRIPLPPAARAPGHAGGRHLPVGRDRRHARGDARARAAGSVSSAS